MEHRGLPPAARIDETLSSNTLQHLRDVVGQTTDKRARADLNSFLRGRWKLTFAETYGLFGEAIKSRLFTRKLAEAQDSGIPLEPFLPALLQHRQERYEQAEASLRANGHKERRIPHWKPKDIADLIPSFKGGVARSEEEDAGPEQSEAMEGSGGVAAEDGNDRQETDRTAGDAEAGGENEDGPTQEDDMESTSNGDTATSPEVTPARGPCHGASSASPLELARATCTKKRESNGTCPVEANAERDVEQARSAPSHSDESLLEQSLSSFAFPSIQEIDYAGFDNNAGDVAPAPAPSPAPPPTRSHPPPPRATLVPSHPSGLHIEHSTRAPADRLLFATKESHLLRQTSAMEVYHVSEQRIQAAITAVRSDSTLIPDAVAPILHVFCASKSLHVTRQAFIQRGDEPLQPYAAEHPGQPPFRFLLPVLLDLGRDEWALAITSLGQDDCRSCFSWRGPVDCIGIVRHFCHSLPGMREESIVPVQLPAADAEAGHAEDQPLRSIAMLLTALCTVAKLPCPPIREEHIEIARHALLVTLHLMHSLDLGEEDRSIPSTALRPQPPGISAPDRVKQHYAQQIPRFVGRNRLHREACNIIISATSISIRNIETLVRQESSLELRELHVLTFRLAVLRKVRLSVEHDLDHLADEYSRACLEWRLVLPDP